MIEFNLINQVVVFLIDAIGIWLAFWILLSNRKAKINQAFFLLTIFILLWITFGFLSHLPSQFSVALLWKRLIFGSASCFFVSMYFFATLFPIKEKRYLLLDKVILITGLTLFIISVFTDSIIKAVEFREWGVDVVFGESMPYFYGMVFFLTTLIVGLLFKKY